MSSNKASISSLPDDGKGLHDFLPISLEAEGSVFRARAGRPLLPDQMPTGLNNIVDSLKQIYDPELPVNIYDLGLIYRYDIDDQGQVDVDMTLTAPGCPVAGTFPGQIAETLAKLEGVGEVTVNLVWEPSWHRGMMSDDAQLALGLA